MARLDSLDDLGTFVASDSFNSQAGVNRLLRFLTEDDQELQENNGYFDETGYDGLRYTDEQPARDALTRRSQRARSAVYLALHHLNDTKYEPYDNIDLNKSAANSSSSYSPFKVFLMTAQGEHKIWTTCLPTEHSNGIVFVSQDTDVDCAEKARVAGNIQRKVRNYFRQSGLA